MMRHYIFILILVVYVSLGRTYPLDKNTNGINTHICFDRKDVQDEFPHWCALMNQAFMEPILFHKMIHLWSKFMGLLVSPNSRKPRNDIGSLSFMSSTYRHLRQSTSTLPLSNQTCSSSSSSSSSSQLPIVFAHGMGDSCFNSGMISIVKRVSQWTGNYVICVPMGSNQQEDTQSGFFFNMNSSVDLFARRVKEDSNLAQGFHAIGFSQGNNILRGYIEKYNDPIVHTFLSINGVNAGIAAVPYCIPKSNSFQNIPSSDLATYLSANKMVCNALMEMASHKAYNSFAQLHSFQANYWRDPRVEMWEKYIQYSQLAYYNNEIPNYNQTFKENFAKTKKFVWIMAEKDEIVWPYCGEQWCAPDSGAKDPFQSPLLARNETAWYQNDLFGLKTAEDAGKNFYESFNGGHLQFTMDEFHSWIVHYLCT